MVLPKTKYKDPNKDLRGYPPRHIAENPISFVKNTLNRLIQENKDPNTAQILTTMEKKSELQPLPSASPKS